MSLDVAIQSVVFYVLSCATCTKIHHRRKAKQAAKRERVEKHAIETEQPGLYRHPSPFCTNPYWDEEIMLGPGPPKRKADRGGSKNASSRALNATGKGSSVISSGCISTDSGSSPTMVVIGERLSGDDWNRKRYQREDEELWGHDTHRTSQKIRDALAKAESSVGSTLRMIEGRLSKSGPSKEEERSPYYVARNPPVNDLHPPVVSTQPTSKGATRWMLQPPPPAKVMEGKEKASRSRSASRGSSRLGVDATNLSRQVTGRAVEEKLRRGETPSDLELPSLSSRPHSRSKTPGPGTPKSKPVSRGRSHSLDSSGSSDGGLRRKRKPPPFALAVDESSSQYTIEHVPVQSDDTTSEKGAVNRLALATIASSSTVVPVFSSATPNGTHPQPKEELSSTTLGSPLTPKVSSPTNSLSSHLNTMPVLFLAVHSKFPGADTYKFPPRKSQEENSRQEQEVS